MAGLLGIMWRRKHKAEGLLWAQPQPHLKGHTPISLPWWRWLYQPIQAQREDNALLAWRSSGIKQIL
ncbi:hypothetical protein CMK12_15950 [Candidatus Poribacteria bacterium]|nr:hypothetical protein [Candidatus Poribacteria bacterium]